MGTILLLCTLACAKVTIQGMFAKNKVKSFVDGIFFNGLIFCFSTFVFIGGISKLNFEVFLWGITLGTGSVFFQMFYVKAMSCGNVSITALIVNMSMIFPILVSFFFFDEKITFLRGFGIFLTVISLILSVRKTALLTDFKKWLFYSCFASFLSGLINLCQQFFNKTQWKDQTSGFIFANYLAASTLSLIIFCIARKKGNTLSFPIRFSVFGVAAAVGSILAIFQFLNVRAIAAIDAALLFPAYNGGTLILATLSGVFILKDRLSKRQLTSVLIGISAIILMNM